MIDEITWDTFDERTRIWMHVSYPFCDMQAIIVAAVSGGRSEKEGDR